jgi:hypothetical protein
MMDVVDFASHVYKLLRRRENEIKDFLAADGLPNWEEYKKLVGELRGLPTHPVKSKPAGKTR